MIILKAHLRILNSISDNITSKALNLRRDPPTMIRRSQRTSSQNGIQAVSGALKTSSSKKRKNSPKFDTAKSSKKEKLDLPMENETSLNGNEIKGQRKKSNKKNELDRPLKPPSKYSDLGQGPEAVPSTGKKYVGCHVSAAGGIWNAFINGRNDKAQSIALFLRSQRSWNAKPLDEHTICKWKEENKDFASHLILPHGSYLMNLGSPKPEVLQKSRNLLIEEMQRCESLGIINFNFHPGSTLGEISREECCHLVAESINLAHEKTKNVVCVIENMSKQGFTIGGDFHEIRLIIENVKDTTRVGVCLDTCHSHAAGYDLSTQEGFQVFLDDFERIIGWKFLRALHINDSKGNCGDHKDRHENIGRGTIGLAGFKRIMNEPKFNDIPLILETPFNDPNTYAKEIVKLKSLIENK